ncbi:MAG: glyoxalase [Nitrospiraceae bacterium]
MTRGIKGLWHLALKVTDLNRSRTFYEQLFGMRVVWQPDPDNVYLSSGSDNLALHQIPSVELENFKDRTTRFMDHFGIVMDSCESVDQLFERVDTDGERFGATVVHRPRRHRDGSYSFYMTDPDGNTVQVLYEPTISRKEG